MVLTLCCSPAPPLAVLVSSGGFRGARRRCRRSVVVDALARHPVAAARGFRRRCCGWGALVLCITLISCCWAASRSADYSACGRPPAHRGVAATALRGRRFIPTYVRKKKRRRLGPDRSGRTCVVHGSCHNSAGPDITQLNAQLARHCV